MKSIKNKKSIFVIIFLLVISSTVAYLYSSDTFQNIFVAASYKVTVVETFESPTNWKPGDTTPKTATLKNEGTVPIKVRVKLEEEWKDSNGEELTLTHNDENVSIINFSNEEDYIYRDGYYYYDLPLEPGETTSSIIESVTFNPNYSGAITCVNNNDSTHTCSSSDSGYEGGTYKLTLTIEGVQEDYYVQAWNLSGPIQHQYLYNVLKEETESNGLAKKYRGAHHDSFTDEPSKDIYHWYGSNSTQRNQILNKNNVIFGEYCWRMFRTTDTGGVKLLYNGEAENNQCLDNRANHVGYNNNIINELNDNYWYGTDYEYDSTNNAFRLSGSTEQVIWNNSTYPRLINKYTCKSSNKDDTCSTLYLVQTYYSESQARLIQIVSNSAYYHIGKIYFNRNKIPLFSIGYKNSIRYTKNSKEIGTKSKYYSIVSVISPSTDYYYAESITYDSSTNKYTLVNPYKISDASDYPNLIGKYTLKSSNASYSGLNASYIAKVNNSTAYYVEVNNGKNIYDYKYAYGDSFTDNGNGQYTIDNPTIINKYEWVDYYNLLGSDKYICELASNNSCSELWYSIKTTINQLEYFKVSTIYKYANSFTYENGVYKLSRYSTSFWNIDDNNNQNALSNAHYTCWDNVGECSTISYIYAISFMSYPTGLTAYYINLEDGESIEDAYDKMLHNEDINEPNSIIKTAVDSWFEKKLLRYENNIEDTIYCNDKSISSHEGFNPNGGKVSGGPLFANNTELKDLSCNNVTDQLSVSNSAAKLKYKVGLITAPEIRITNYSLLLEDDCWTMSPISSDNVAKLIPTGYINTGDTRDNISIRPVISLKPGIEYIVGDGSMTNPYIVKMN